MNVIGNMEQLQDTIIQDIKFKIEPEDVIDTYEEKYWQDGVIFKTKSDVPVKPEFSVAKLENPDNINCYSELFDSIYGIKQEKLKGGLNTRDKLKELRCIPSPDCMAIKCSELICMDTDLEKTPKSETCNLYVLESDTINQRDLIFREKMFIIKPSLDYNIRTIHTDEKQLQCKICNKMCVSNSAMNVHIQASHPDKPFLCQFCAKTFICQSDLTIHIRTHTGEKPYQCKLCEKKFCVNSKLNRHLKTHTNDKRY